MKSDSYKEMRELAKAIIDYIKSKKKDDKNG